jgi:hypothetical protein
LSWLFDEGRMNNNKTGIVEVGRELTPSEKQQLEGIVGPVQDAANELNALRANYYHAAKAYADALQKAADVIAKLRVDAGLPDAWDVAPDMRWVRLGVVPVAAKPTQMELSLTTPPSPSVAPVPDPVGEQAPAIAG